MKSLDKAGDEGWYRFKPSGWVLNDMPLSSHSPILLSSLVFRMISRYLWRYGPTTAQNALPGLENGRLTKRCPRGTEQAGFGH